MTDRAARHYAEFERLAHVGSWSWDVEADVVEWSDELYRIFGIQRQDFEATYEAYLGHIHPDDREMVNETVQTAFGAASSYSLEHRVLRPDGTTRWIHGRGDVEANAVGDVVRLYGVAIDITDRKRTEEFLRSFIANAAHELRTPVASITSAIDLLGQPDLAEQERGPLLGALQRQGARLRRLAGDLLDLSALDRGAEYTMIGPVEIAPIVEAALSAVPATALMDVDVAVEGITVLGDAGHLERILVNLFSNVERHGGKELTVTAVLEGYEVVITVHDNGPGVPAALIPDLFVPFSHGTGAAAGAGLGLAISRRLAEALGGSLDYRGGDGATFELRLERAEPVS